jgi:hypothetical protein
MYGVRVATGNLFVTKTEQCEAMYFLEYIIKIKLSPKYMWDSS